MAFPWLSIPPLRGYSVPFSKMYGWPSLTPEKNSNSQENFGTKLLKRKDKTQKGTTKVKRFNAPIDIAPIGLLLPEEENVIKNT